jgi:predicted carbohydrate-binding protein with CBM5 and CBM33 domain
MSSPKRKIETIINHIYAEHAKLAQANYQMVTLLQQRDKERAAAQTLILHQRRRLQASEQWTRELEQQIHELKVAMAAGIPETSHMSQVEHYQKKL